MPTRSQWRRYRQQVVCRSENSLPPSLQAFADATRWKSPTTALGPAAMSSPAASNGRLELLPRHQRQRGSSLAPQFRKRKPAQS